MKCIGNEILVGGCAVRAGRYFVQINNFKETLVTGCREILGLNINHIPGYIAGLHLGSDLSNTTVVIFRVNGNAGFFGKRLVMGLKLALGICTAKRCHGDGITCNCDGRCNKKDRQ